MLPLNYSATTHKGLCRSNNEDSYLSQPETGLWVVADGMGGHEAGEVASAIVCDTFQKNPKRHPLSDSIQDSHHAVLEAAEQGVGAQGMGSTIVALSSEGHGYQVSWVGDSRAYLWTVEENGGRLEQLTTDHSYVQMLLASGAIAEDEVESHPEKNIITQCLGSQELKEVSVDSVYGIWEDEQWIILCSDGLSDELNDKDIAQVLCHTHSPADAAEQLLKASLAQGGHDNITIQVIESPRKPPHPLACLNELLPSITNNKIIDRFLYSCALVSLTLLIFWLVG